MSDPDREPSPSFQQTSLLLASAQAGEPEAIDALLTRFLPRVRRIVAARTGHRLRALLELDDVVQQTLLDAFRDLRAGEQHSIGAFYNWLARAVVNNLADEARRSAAQKRGNDRVRRFADLGDTTLAAALPGDTIDSPCTRLSAAELDGRLEEALLALRAEHREVVVLRVLCEMSFAEIATQMQLSGPDLARAWFSRAMAQMRARLGPRAES